MGLGWQGVVPRKAVKMARTAFACARPHLLGPKEWFACCDPCEIADKVFPQRETSPLTFHCVQQ
eukprot:4498067-Amphidinium_carterae.1